MPQEKLCKNCNSELTGIYCSECGQKDTELLSVKAIVREFTDNVFSFDSRFFISLKYLVTKPGFLTTEYWAGRRTKYLPPLRIYLVLSVFYFFFTPLLDSDVYDTKLVSQWDDDGVEVPFEIKIDESWNKNIHIYKNIMNKGFIKIIDNPLTEANVLFTYFPSAMFILMPFMSFILFILFRKKQLFFSYHLITILHFNSFVFLTLIIENILQKVIPLAPLRIDFISIPLIFKLLAIGYLLFLLNRIYLESWIKSSIKFIIILITFSTTVALTMASLVLGKVFVLGLRV